MILILWLLFLFHFLMDASPEVLPYAKSYSNWLLIGAIFTISKLVLNNLLRTEGAAIATAISQGISTVLMILFYARKKSQIKLNFVTIFKPTSNDKEIVNLLIVFHQC